MIMLSVLRGSGNHKDLFACFEDFDDYSYEYYVEKTSNSGGGSTGMLQYFQERTDYEIVGGYLLTLRGIPSKDLYTGVKIEPPSFAGISENSFCHLIGKRDANLFAGNCAGRPTFHLIGEEGILVSGLQHALTTYLKHLENPNGLMRDLNACLKYFGKTAL